MLGQVLGAAGKFPGGIGGLVGGGLRGNPGGSRATPEAPTPPATGSVATPPAPEPAAQAPITFTPQSIDAPQGRPASNVVPYPASGSSRAVVPDGDTAATSDDWARRAALANVASARLQSLIANITSADASAIIALTQPLVDSGRESFGAAAAAYGEAGEGYADTGAADDVAPRSFSI